MALPALVLVHGGQHAARLLGSHRRRNPPAGTGIDRARRRSAGPARQARRPHRRHHRRLGGLVAGRHRGRGSRRRHHRRPFDGGADRPRRRDQARVVAGAGDGLRRGFVPPDGRAVVDTLPGWSGGTRAGRPSTGRSGTLPTSSGGVRVLQRDDASSSAGSAATGSTPSRRPSSSRTSTARGNARRRAAHLDPHTARPRPLGEVAAHDRIAALGGVQTVIPIDTCHDLMVSEPKRLAEILVERCRRYA